MLALRGTAPAAVDQSAGSAATPPPSRLAASDRPRVAPNDLQHSYAFNVYPIYRRRRSVIEFGFAGAAAAAGGSRALANALPGIKLYGGGGGGLAPLAPIYWLYQPIYYAVNVL